MKTGLITVTSEGLGMKEALMLTEDVGKDSGLEKKAVLHLRLLAEELFGMLRGIAGEVETAYWLEEENKRFQIHMKSNVEMNEEKRKQFLAVSSNGKNAAAVGFMGKIKVVLAEMLFTPEGMSPYAAQDLVDAISVGYTSEDNSVSTAQDFVDAISMGYTTEGSATIWSMETYRNNAEKQRNKRRGADAAWDELEKSIIANIADDIKVGVVGKNVEITIYKAF